MSVIIRMARHGTRSKPYFRMVVADRRYPKEGRVIETIGNYDPKTNPAKVEIDQERLQFWRERGAQLSDTVRILSKRVINLASTEMPRAEKPTKATKTEKSAEVTVKAIASDSEDTAPLPKKAASAPKKAAKPAAKKPATKKKSSKA